MLTGAGDLVDRVVGLEVGADDYIAKPFDLRELLARIRSVLRAAAGSAAEQPRRGRPAKRRRDPLRQLRPEPVLAAALRADGEPGAADQHGVRPAARRWRTHPNKALNRDQLLDLAHGRDWDPFDRSIDVRITRIRRKIEADPGRPALIRTVRGVGYMFVPDGE